MTVIEDEVSNGKGQGKDNSVNTAIDKVKSHRIEQLRGGSDSGKTMSYCNMLVYESEVEETNQQFSAYYYEFTVLNESNNLTQKLYKPN